MFLGFHFFANDCLFLLFLCVFLLCCVEGAELGPPHRPQTEACAPPAPPFFVFDGPCFILPSCGVKVFAPGQAGGISSCVPQALQDELDELRRRMEAVEAGKADRADLAALADRLACGAPDWTHRIFFFRPAVLQPNRYPWD